MTWEDRTRLKLLRCSFLAILVFSQGACVTSPPRATMGQRVAVPARHEVAGLGYGSGGQDVVGVIVRQAGDTVSLREHPSASVRTFVLPSDARLLPLIARTSTDSWAVGDSLRVRGDGLSASPPRTVVFRWGVDALQGDALVLGGAEVRPLDAYESLRQGTARVERLTHRTRAERGLLIGSSFVAAGVLTLALWPWSDSNCGQFLCLETSDLVGGVLGSSLVGSGLMGMLIAPFVKVEGWDALDPSNLPNIMPNGGDGGLRLTWRRPTR